MEFIFKYSKVLFGPVIQVIGLLGAVVPAQTQEGIVAFLLNTLASPYVFIPTILSGTAATTLAYGALWAEHKLKTAGGVTKREFPARFDNWNKVTNFPVWQVAWLWSGLEPQSSDTKSEGTAAYPAFMKLKEDLDKGRIKDAQMTGDSWCGTTLSRQQLIDYALEIGECPKFLFPSKRKLPSSWLQFDWFLRRVSKGELFAYQKIHELHMYLYSHFTDQGQEVPFSEFDELLRKQLEAGNWKAIGRREENGLLFQFEKIPKRQWKSLKLSYGSASSKCASFRDVRICPARKTST